MSSKTDLRSTLKAIIADDAASENERELAARVLSHLSSEDASEDGEIKIISSEHVHLDGDDNLVSAKHHAFASVVSVNVPVYLMTSDRGSDVWIEGESSSVEFFSGVLKIAEMESERQSSDRRSFAVFRQILADALDDGPSIIDVERIRRVRDRLSLGSKIRYGRSMKTGRLDRRIAERIARSALDR